MSPRIKMKATKRHKTAKDYERNKKVPVCCRCRKPLDVGGIIDTVANEAYCSGKCFKESLQ